MEIFGARVFEKRPPKLERPNACPSTRALPILPTPATTAPDRALPLCSAARTRPAAKSWKRHRHRANNNLNVNEAA
eukprot:6329123-Alexandrium_andersonii.AAC.1